MVNVSRRGAVLGLMLASCATPANTPGTKDRVVEPRPLDVQQPAFKDLIQNKVAVVDLWASWCEPCREEIPKLIRLAETYDSSDVVVVGVNLGEAEEDVRLFVSGFGIHYPIYLDEKFHFADSYQETEIPRILLLAPDARVLYRDGRVSAGLLSAIRKHAKRPNNSRSD